MRERYRVGDFKILRISKFAKRVGPGMVGWCERANFPHGIWHVMRLPTTFAASNGLPGKSDKGGSPEFNDI